jgi:curved DNA-binding protein CbpA
VKSKDYYAALGIEPLAPSAEVKQRVEELHKLFSEMIPRLGRQAAFHVKTAIRVLDRMAQVLYDPRQRLTYDLEKGHVLADERMSRSGESGIFDFGLLREAWHRAHPGKASKAGVHLAKALAAEIEGDFATAAQHGREAHELDPFDSGLMRAVAKWEEKANKPDEG